MVLPATRGKIKMNDIAWQPGLTLEDIEKATILKAFRFYQGNKTKTANSLGIAIRTLDNRLAAYEGKVLPHGEANDVHTESRVHLEPVKKSAPQPSVSMRKR